MSNWVKCSGQLPEESTVVLVVAIGVGPRSDYTTDMYCGWYCNEVWSRWPHPFPPTHWMTLPEAPKETK